MTKSNSDIRNWKFKSVYITIYNYIYNIGLSENMVTLNPIVNHPFPDFQGLAEKV